MGPLDAAAPLSAAGECAPQQ